MSKIKNILADKLSVQLDITTWNRYRLLSPFVVRGPVEVLNIGTGGGVETLNLLNSGNKVTAVEIDDDTADRTQERAKRNGVEDRLKMINSHILNANIQGSYRVVWMTEVLEHIEDDRKVLEKISSLLEPGGRLVMSTPTASWGQADGGSVSLREDGGHVRVGYDGPELDKMLKDVGLLTIRRIRSINKMTQNLHKLESFIKENRFSKPLGILFSLGLRPLMPIVDLLSWDKWFNQITVAIKLDEDKN